MKDKLLEWFATGSVGASSRAIAQKMMGLGDTPERSHPHDPDDLNRCLLLLEAVPEIRDHMAKVAEISETWAKLVKRWDELERCFLDEVGLDWVNGYSAPRTYELMKQIMR